MIHEIFGQKHTQRKPLNFVNTVNDVPTKIGHILKFEVIKNKKQKMFSETIILH